MSCIQTELKALSQLSHEQQKNGLSLLIKIFDDLFDILQCEGEQKLINIKSVLNKTNCSNFIDVLLKAGYYKINNGKQLRFNTSKLQQLKVIYAEIIEYKQNLGTVLSRNTIKLESYKSSKEHIVGTSNRDRAPNKLCGYKIMREIGRGAWGTVYQCTNSKLRVFAIKIFNKQNISKSAMKSVLSEIEILKSVPSHPNIVKLIEVVEDDVFIGIVLPYFESGSLYSFIRAYGIGTLTELHVKAFITQILKAVEFLHKNGIIHRDIKAANVLITNDGVTKLADFGIAMYYDDNMMMDEKDMDENDNNNNMDPAGSPYWMAPEIIEMKQITEACDIWAIGATAIELFCGLPPYHNLTPMSALFRIVKDDYPKIPQQSSYLFKDFLYQCFCKNPSQRLSASDLLNHKWIKNIENESF